MVSGVFFSYQLSAISGQLSAVRVSVLGQCPRSVSSVRVRVSVLGQSQSQSLTNDLLTILSS